MDITDKAKEIEFIYRPDPVPFNYRISYKVAQICLIIYSLVKKRGCSLPKLQMVSSALTSEYDMHEILEFIEGRIPDYSIIRFEPSVNRALRYGIVEKLIERQQNGKYKLTPKGQVYAELIYKDAELMNIEKERLNKLIGRLNEEEILKLVDRWSAF